MLKREGKIAIAVGVVLVAIWTILMLGRMGRGDAPSNNFKTVSMTPTHNVRLGSNNVEVTPEELSVQNSSLSPRYHVALSVPSVGNYRVGGFRSASSSMQRSGTGALYSTASVSPHSYGGGSSMAGGSYQNSQSRNSVGYNANTLSSAGDLHTFVAISANVRATSEEFESGANAIGADSPAAVRRRTPGGGPVTDDPGHQPTVVETTPIGDGVWFLMLMAIGYFVKNLVVKRVVK